MQPGVSSPLVGALPAEPGNSEGVTSPGVLGAAWSPAQIVGAQFVANPDNAATLTLVSSTHISAMSDDAGGSYVLAQGTDANRFRIDQGTTLGGHVTMACAGTGESLSSATGGVTGNADHAILLVARLDTLGTYELIAAMGAVGSDGGIGSTSTGSAWWFGGSGKTTPVGQLPDNTIGASAPAYTGIAADTTTFHVFAKVHKSGVDRCYIDGYLVTTATVTYALAAGFGFLPHSAGFEDLAHTAHAVFATAAISQADRQKYETWGCTHFGSTLGHAEARRPQVVCVVDSLTHGSGATTGTSDYPKQMAALLSITSSVWNLGVPGHTLDQADAQVEADIAGHTTAMASSIVVVIWGGVNNLTATYTSPTAPSDTFAKLVTYIADVRTYAPPGASVVVCTQTHASLTWTGVTNQAALNAAIDSYNVLIKGGAGTYGYTVADLAADSRLDANVTPSNSADGLHFNASGYAVVASIAAAVVNPLLH